MSKPREIHIVLTVADDKDYARTVELVAASLFKGNAWLPGFLFQSHFKGWRLTLDRKGPYIEGSNDEPSS